MTADGRFFGLACMPSFLKLWLYLERDSGDLSGSDNILSNARKYPLSHRELSHYITLEHVNLDPDDEHLSLDK